MTEEKSLDVKSLKDGNPWFLYGFFIVHMGMFGFSGFMIAYAETSTDVAFLYMHGGIAIFVYIVFYLAIFGMDEVKWIFINSLLGLFGIYVEIDWILSLFDRRLEHYPFYVHVIPFMYYILYTFLLRRAVIDLTMSRNNPRRKKIVEYGYILVSLLVYSWLYYR